MVKMPLRSDYADYKAVYAGRMLGCCECSESEWNLVDGFYFVLNYAKLPKNAL